MDKSSRKVGYIQYFVWWVINCSQHTTKDQIKKDVEGVCRELWLMDSDKRLSKEVDFLSVLRLVDYDVQVAKEHTLDSALEIKTLTRFSKRVRQFAEGTGDW